MAGMQLGPTGSYINIEPLYSYTFTETANRNDIRTKQGNLYTYIKPTTMKKFKLPMSWVTAANRTLINSWWKTSADLDFIENSDFPSSKESVRIMEGKDPLTSYVKPDFQINYEGMIILETI